MTGRCVVILPTLNEAQNLTALVPAIYAQLPDATVLIVDHQSPDGTAGVAMELGKRFPSLMVLKVADRGLAKAYRIGYAYAIANGFDYAIQMDADGSHDPALLGSFAMLSRQFDLIVGSRYLPALGRRHCSWMRRALSAGAHWYVRAWLHIPLSDVTSGYRLLSRPFMEKLLAVDLGSAGYAIQIETAWIATRQHWRMREVPIEFLARAHGKSKLSLGVLAEAICRVPWLRIRELAR
jgi:dolichol-phosphate mannosyltransferase